MLFKKKKKNPEKKCNRENRVNFISNALHVWIFTRNLNKVSTDVSHRTILIVWWTENKLRKQSIVLFRKKKILKLLFYIWLMFTLSLVPPKQNCNFINTFITAQHFDALIVKTLRSTHPCINIDPWWPLIIYLLITVDVLVDFNNHKRIASRALLYLLSCNPWLQCFVILIKNLNEIPIQGPKVMLFKLLMATSLHMMAVDSSKSLKLIQML